MSNKRFKITETKLKYIIKECIYDIINEGYSSKNHQEGIVNAAKEIYSVIIEQGNPSYSTSYKNCKINAQLSSKENAYANRGGISIFVTKETSVNTIAKLLMHEFTHIFDIQKNRETNFNDDDFYYGIKDLYDVPEAIKDIIYHLWIPTEFNAFQTTYDFKDENFNTMFERFMGYIQEAYEMPTTKSYKFSENYYGRWVRVRNAIINHIPNKYKKCDIDTFKKYFINQSMALMKKMVKKWNGEQNIQFV